MTMPGRIVLRRSGFPRLRTLVAAAAWALCEASRALAAEAPGDPAARKSVLLLNVEQPHLPWVAGISSGIFAAFDAAPPSSRPEVQTEYLDVIRMPDHAAAQTVWFRERYSGQHFDAIIAVTNPALSFVLPLRNELWPDAKIVLLTPSRSLQGTPLPEGVIGLGARFEVERTLELAKSIVPGTLHVAYVAEDASDNDHWRSDLTARGLDLVDLTGLRLEELEKRIASLPPHTVVFFESFHSDGTGRRFVPRDVLARVAPLSNSPIFGVSATMMGHGLTGGWVLDYSEVGAETARTTLRILAGEQVGKIPDPSTFSRLTFDGRELRRWKIPGSRVPGASRVLYREPSLWNDHRGAVIAAVIALLLQGGLIAALLVARRRRHEADVEARRHREEIAHLNRVGAVGELASSLAHEINQPLAAILTNAQAAQRILGRASPDLEEVRGSLKDIIEDDQRAGEVIHRMRSLMRKEESRRSAVDLNDVAQRVLRLVASDAQLRNVSLDPDLAQGLPAVAGDSVQLQQVVLNLVANGLDAVADRPPGQRSVAIRTAAANGSAELSVTDSGRGIRADDLGRVFEPFYTTKPEGLGMGLPICRSIVEAHLGRLLVESAVGGGATFRCVFPAQAGNPA